MKVIAVFTAIVLLTGIMMMSIPDDAFAGKGDKRVNITVFDPDGSHSANASCLLVVKNAITGDPVFSNTFNVGNGGNKGVNISANIISGITVTATAACNNSNFDAGEHTVTLIKHTTKLHVQLA